MNKEVSSAILGASLQTGLIQPEILADMVLTASRTVDELCIAVGRLSVLEKEMQAIKKSPGDFFLRRKVKRVQSVLLAILAAKRLVLEEFKNDASNYVCDECDDYLTDDTDYLWAQFAEINLDYLAAANRVLSEHEHFMLDKASGFPRFGPMYSAADWDSALEAQIAEAA